VGLKKSFLNDQDLFWYEPHILKIVKHAFRMAVPTLHMMAIQKPAYSAYARSKTHINSKTLEINS
jgi:hypothetical protein